MWLEIVAGICLAWYLFIVLVCSIGYLQLLRNYSSPPKKPISSALGQDEVPHVTVIRPCKGLEPYLDECLAATFHQDYPIDKLTIYFCVSSREDAAYPVIKRVLATFPSYDAKVFLEDEDPTLQTDGQGLGPNPKIRNMSRAYREAKGDIVWILDCNVWVGRGICGRMVDKLYGITRNGRRRRPYKFVHNLPICIDVDVKGEDMAERQSLLADETIATSRVLPELAESSTPSSILDRRGGRLEELFLSSSHAKMYVAINTVAVAPCILGKSNMFRRSHLNYLTSPPTTNRLSSSNPATSESHHSHSVGIDHFSHNICEDHLIGDLLWRSSIPDEPHMRNHGLVLGDLAIQPLARMSVKSYIARRVRWLRVRKFTVTLATLVEPGTESFLCSAYGAFAVVTLPWFRLHLGIAQTWTTFILCWLSSILMWAAVDWTVYLLLHSGKTVEAEQGIDESIPLFARPLKRLSRRPFSEWLLAWLGREALALPVWIWAFYGGVTVVWRDRKFWVGLDMKVHEIDDSERHKGDVGGHSADLAGGNGVGNGGKARID